MATAARQVARSMQAEGAPVRFLRSVFVPEDGACFFLYEGPSAQVAREAVERATASVCKVIEATRLGQTSIARTAVLRCGVAPVMKDRRPIATSILQT